MDESCRACGERCGFIPRDVGAPDAPATGNQLAQAEGIGAGVLLLGGALLLASSEKGRWLPF